MADEADRAQPHIEAALARNIAAASARFGPGVEYRGHGQHVTHCTDCGERISEDRKAILQHAIRCSGCQTQREIKEKGK
jgi:RNA polymerase-binding transcription factor DksA